MLRVRDSQDIGAWEEFASLYGPLIHRVACKNGLQDADAADLVQDVLTSISQSIGRLDYDPNLGRFRSWLFTVARNRMANFAVRQGRHPRGSGDSGIQRAIEVKSVADSELARIWDEEYERRVFQWAVDRTRPNFATETWQAFWGTAVDGHKPTEVAKRLGMSVGAVYIAKSRVIARLKETISQVGDR